MKYLPFYLIVCCFVTLSACNSDQKPSNVLPKEKMVEILTNLHLVEAYINSNFPHSDSSKFLYKKLEDSVIIAHGSDAVTYDSSMAYYQRHVELLDGIYGTVVDSLSLKESVLKK